MIQNKKLFIQMTTRVYKDRNPRLYHLLEQIDCSHSDLITMLSEQAIKMGGLEDVHPRDILNGTCYSERRSSLNNDHAHQISTSHIEREQNPTVHNNGADSGLCDEILNLGIMK